MSLLSALYKLEPKFSYGRDGKTLRCTIKSENGQIWGRGFSTCAKSDEEFESEIVGKNIAFARARIFALEVMLTDARTDYTAVKQYYDNATRNMKNVPASFTKHLENMKDRVSSIKVQLKLEKANLYDYLNRLRATNNKLRAIRAEKEKDKA